jgi:7-cyano-7-deazaguanine reductase
MDKNTESKYLGKKTGYPVRYSPVVLLPIRRFENREQYGIPEHPDFTGIDVWHAYEFGFLTHKGLPVTGILKIGYPSSNLFIVESKSLKLYLNSFNMERFGDTRNEGLEIVLDLIHNDLEKILQTKVEIHFFGVKEDSFSDFSSYQRLESLVDEAHLEFDQFKENPSLLEIESDGRMEIQIFSDILRSNCKVTHQPDWGSVFIHLKSSGKLNLESLLKYLVSFRNENHFHEEVCEIIYKRLSDLLQPDELMVACIYTRRGGIDICPVRANKMELLPKFLINPRVLDKKLLRQ